MTDWKANKARETLASECFDGGLSLYDILSEEDALQAQIILEGVLEEAAAQGYEMRARIAQQVEDGVAAKAAAAERAKWVKVYGDADDTMLFCGRHPYHGDPDECDCTAVTGCKDAAAIRATGGVNG